MASENVKDHRLFMSEGLKNITGKMVFEGVTPKSGMRKVKAMKRLWRSDSFQMMKSILEEPPIQEGRSRPSRIPLKDDEDDELAETEASPRDTALEREMKEKGAEFNRRKEELKEIYQNCLNEDLANLRTKTDEIVSELIKKARIGLEGSEGGQLEDAVKQKIVEMLHLNKCIKKNRNKSLKMALEEDRKVVTEELRDYMEREMEIRIKAYTQLLEKVYNYKLKLLEDSVADDYEDQLRQRIRISINKFECAKDRLLKKQKTDLEDLNCRLAVEFAEHVKWSGDRMNSMLDDAISDLLGKEDVEEVKAEESECCLAARMQSKLRLQGWLPLESSKDEDWGSLVKELMDIFQLLIELVMKDEKMKQNEYLISMEKLKSLKDQIAQINQRKLIETREVRRKRKIRVKAKLRAASFIDQLIRQVLPSPLPSRYSISQLFQKPKCFKPHRSTVISDKYPASIHEGNRKMSKTSELAKRLSKAVHAPSHMRTSSIETKAVRKQIESRLIDIEAFQNDSRKQSKQSKGEPVTQNTGVLSEKDRDSYVNILHKNPELYNIFFYNL